MKKMKKIKITESQYKRIFESDGVVGLDANSDIKKYNPSEVSTTANITDPDGNTEYGKPIETDNVSKQMVIQNWWSGPLKGTRYV